MCLIISFYDNVAKDVFMFSEERFQYFDNKVGEQNVSATLCASISIGSQKWCISL